jgi:hypothetical protein
VTGFLVAALPNATLFWAKNPLRLAAGAAVVVATSVLSLAPIPYLTHRGTRPLQVWVKGLVGAFFVAPLAAWFLCPRYAFDVLFVFAAGYALGAWIPLAPDERRAFYTEWRRWSSAVGAK